MTHRHAQRLGLGRSLALGAALSTLLLATACGNEQATPSASSTRAGTPAADAGDPALGEGRWLIAVSTAGGADAETSTTVYVSYDPSTGEASARAMPPVQAASSGDAGAGLLLSGDRAWAIPDTSTTPAQEKSARLAVQSLAGPTAKTLDLRALTGQPRFLPVGWAFDPTTPDTLRVVGADNSVWSLSVSGGQAARESSLPTGPWVFTAGFNKNTGIPYVESIDSDETLPPGNGAADTSPLSRADGTVLPSGSDALTALPPSPCRLGGGFTAADGTSWVFCADAPTISTYYLRKDGTEWTAYGKPSAAVLPEAASVPLVLPPTT